MTTTEASNEITIEQMLERIESTKQKWLDSRAEWIELNKQQKRNERSLNAAREQHELLSKQWRAKAHESGLKASGEARTLLQESIAARGEAEQLQLLVEEGPDLLEEKEEAAVEAKNQYFTTLWKYERPITRQRLEEAAAEIRQSPELAQVMSALSQYLTATRRWHMENAKIRVGYHEFDPWPLVGDDDMELIEDFAMNKRNRKDVVPFLESLGLEIGAPLPDELQPPKF